MSDDLYDSLEDECNRSRGSSNSLDPQQTVSVKMVSKFRSLNRHSSFCFRNKKEKDFSPSTKAVSVNTSHKNNFLPIIINKNSMPGLQELFDHSADYETLTKKGLLLNRDGSFTKSKSDAEELPFITREYKNLVFQKQKAYNSKKKTQTKGFNKKQPSNCDLCCSDKKNVEIIKRKCLTKEESTKVDRNSLMNENLTDSMKRILLQNKTRKNKQNPGQNPKFCFSETRTLRHRFSERRESHEKNCKPLDKHLSQSALTGPKRNLTYLERHQLQNGYNPWFLRHGLKNITSDTTRSTFGDSVIGKLSEVSSRVFSNDDVADLEAEEEFYKEIMEKDRDKATKPEGSNVAGPLEISRHGSKIGSDFIKQLEKLRESGRSYKRILKPLRIDLKNDGEPGNNKCSHFCSGNPSPKMSKTELVLKGKTYGFLANARNILKFKSRIEGKMSGRENLSPKNNATDLCLEKGSEFAEDLKKKSLPTLSLEKNKLRSGEMQNQVRSTKDQQRFCLPHISSSEHETHNGNSKNLTRMSSCLYCPGR